METVAESLNRKFEGQCRRTDKRRSNSIITEKSSINLFQKRQLELIQKCIEGIITSEESQEFIRNLVFMFIKLNIKKPSLNAPTLDAKALNTSNNRDSKHFGSYYSERGKSFLEYAEDYFLDENKILRLDRLPKLVNTIGHEMTHHRQHEEVYNFSQMSEPSKKRASIETKKRISQIDFSYRDLSKRDLKTLLSQIRPNLPDNFSEEEYNAQISDKSFESYLSLPYEIEAREGGIDFMEKIMKLLLHSSYLTPEVEEFLTGTYKNSVQEAKNREEINKKRIENYKKFLGVITTNEDIIKLHIITSRNGNGISFYDTYFDFMVQQKPLNEKLSLLELAIKYNLPLYIYIKIIINDPEAKNNIEEIKAKFNKLLFNKSNVELDKNSNVEVALSSIGRELFDKIYTNEDYKNLVTNLVKSNSKLSTDQLEVYLSKLTEKSNYGDIKAKNEGADFVLNTISIIKEQIMQYISNEKNITSGDGLDENKINLEITLQNLQAIKRKILSLFNNEKDKENPFKRVDSLKNEVDSLINKISLMIKLKSEKENKLDEEKQDLKESDIMSLDSLSNFQNDEEFSVLIKYYANSNLKYHSSKHHSLEQISIKKKVDKQMQEILDKKIDNYDEKNADDNIINQVIEQLKNPVDEKQIEIISNNELAYMKLFQIAASGMYENGEKKIKLNSKQQTALANILIKVSQKLTEREQLNKKDAQKPKTSQDYLKSNFANLSNLNRE